MCSVLVGRVKETHGMMESSTSLLESCLHRGIYLSELISIMCLCTLPCILILSHGAESVKHRKQLTSIVSTFLKHNYCNYKACLEHNCYVL
jgi:hypothetical protein